MSETGVFLTRAAEGLDRRGFTLAEVEKMIAVGVIDADEKFELIDGEIVPKSPQATPHLVMKGRIARWLGAAAPQTVDVIQNATLLIAEQTFFEPDILVLRPDRQRRYPEPDQALLVVEIADSSRARPPHQGAALWRRRRAGALGGGTERTRDLRVPQARHGRLGECGAGELRRRAGGAVPAGAERAVGGV